MRGLSRKVAVSTPQQEKGPQEFGEQVHGTPELQTQVALRCIQRRAGPAFVNPDLRLLNALKSGFHRHSGSGYIAVHVREHIAGLVILNNGEFSRS